MNTKTVVLAGLLAIGYVLPAAAQTSFFIVRDPQTKHCTILDKKPVATETTVVKSGGTTYTTRTEAENGMLTIKECTPDWRLQPSSPRPL